MGIQPPLQGRSRAGRRDGLDGVIEEEMLLHLRPREGYPHPVIEAERGVDRIEERPSRMQVTRPAASESGPGR